MVPHYTPEKNMGQIFNLDEKSKTTNQILTDKSTLKVHDTKNKVLIRQECVTETVCRDIT